MQDRTEAPTPKRLDDARRRGQVVRSVELVSVAGLLGLVLGAPWYVPMLYQGLGEAMQEEFRHLVRPDLTADMVAEYGRSIEWTTMRILLPVLAMTTVVGVAANIGQTGFMLTLQPLTPQLSRIDPIAGLQRLFSMRSFIEMVKTTVKLAIIGTVTYLVLRDHVAALTALVGTDIRGTTSLLLEASRDLVLKAGLAMGVMAVTDYLVQRWQVYKSLRMTKQEVREENRQSEGDPVIRSHMRRRQRQLATHRMMAAVPTADVVVTNPTHFAVAIAYAPHDMRAPKVVAKGQWLMAQRIKAVAEEAGVPVVENVPLARALYAAVEIGQEIPPALYQAVAEVLAFIYRLKRRIRHD